MEHLERHGFLRRGIARHARLSLQLRNQSARTLAQAPSWRRHSSPPLPSGVGSRLEAQGSRLRAPGSRLHYVRTLRLVGTTLSSWAGLHRLWAPGRATHSGRAARPRRARWEAAVWPMGPGQRRRFCGVPSPGPRLRVQQHALASPQTQAQYLDLGDGTVTV